MRTKNEELYNFFQLAKYERGVEYINFLSKVTRLLKPNDYNKINSSDNVATNNGMLYETDKIYRLVKNFMKDFQYNRTFNQNQKARQLNIKEKYSDDYILRNLEQIIKLEIPNIDEKDLKRIQELVLEYQQENKATAQNIDFNILDEKYTSIFSKDQLSLIISYPVIQDAILSLTENELDCLTIALDDYIEREKKIINNDNESDWNYQLEDFLASFMSEQYKPIINEIGNISDTEKRNELYRKLGYILTEPNFYNITSVNELEVYSNIKKKVLKDLVNGECNLEKYPLIAEMSKLEQNRFAILQHYGIHSGAEIIQMFNPKNFPKDSADNELFQVIDAIRKVYEINDEKTMNKIAKDIIDTIYLDEQDSSTRFLQKSVKLFIENEYNMELTDISTLHEMNDEEKYKYCMEDYDGQIFDATDSTFKLMVTSIAPYSNDANAVEIENYCDYWNRKYKKAQFFCYSHISNDNISTAEIPHTLVGVSEVEGLQYVAPFDSNSNSNLMSPTTDTVIFLPFDELSKYNQMTEINSKRVQPTYISILKKYGELVNYEQAKKAAKDFGDLPLVLIDTDKLRYKQLSENIKLIHQYQTTNNPELLPRIAQNISFSEEIEEFYELDEDEIDIISESCGNISSSFKQFIKDMDIDQLVNELNLLDYADENFIDVKLEDIITQNIDLQHNLNTVASLEANTSDISSSEIEYIRQIITRPLENKRNIGD